MSHNSGDHARRERLAAALRENLKRRKFQARAKASAGLMPRAGQLAENGPEPDKSASGSSDES